MDRPSGESGGTADALSSGGSVPRAWGFKSPLSHQQGPIINGRACFVFPAHDAAGCVLRTGSEPVWGQPGVGLLVVDVGLWWVLREGWVLRGAVFMWRAPLLAVWSRLWC